MSFDLHWSFGFIEISPLKPSTRSKIQKNYFGFTHSPLKFISSPRKDKHFIGQLWQPLTASNVGAWTQAWLDVKIADWFSTNFIICRVSFVLRCFYKSTLVACAVARTVSRSVWLSFGLHWSFGFIGISPLTPSTRSKIPKKLFWFHTRASKVHYRSSEGQTFYWSIITADDSIKFRHEKPSGRFSKSRGLSASVSFLSSPPPPRSFTCVFFRAVFDSCSSFFAPI